jgi:hypothetical protein
VCQPVQCFLNIKQGVFQQGQCFDHQAGKV